MNEWAMVKESGQDDVRESKETDQTHCSRKFALPRTFLETEDSKMSLVIGACKMCFYKWENRAAFSGTVVVKTKASTRNSITQTLRLDSRHSTPSL